MAGALALPAFFLYGWMGAYAQAAKSGPPKAPLGLPPLSWPRDNPYSPAKVELGRTLYFDRRVKDGRTKRDAIRILQRYIAREVYRYLPRG